MTAGKAAVLAAAGGPGDSGRSTSSAGGGEGLEACGSGPPKAVIEPTGVSPFTRGDACRSLSSALELPRSRRPGRKAVAEPATCQ